MSILAIPNACAKDTPTHPAVLALLLQGGAARRAGQRDLELRIYRLALERAQEFQNVRGEAGALGSIAVTYLETNRPQQALEFLARALPLWRRTEDRGAEGWVLSTMGGIYSRLGQADRARILYQEALALYRVAKVTEGEGRVIQALVSILSKSGDDAGAQEFALRTLELKRAANDPPGEIDALNSLAEGFAAAGESERAVAFKEDAVALSHRIKDLRREAETLNSLGRLQATFGRLESALERFRGALALYRTLKESEGEGCALMWSGEACARLGQPNEAFGYLQQALFTFRQGGHTEGEGWVLLDVGGVYADLGDDDQALDFYRMALPLHQASGSREAIGASLTWLGLMEVKRGLRSRGLEKLQQALSLFRSIRSQEGEAWALAARGHAYSALGQARQSVDWYRQALQVFRQVDNRASEAAMLGDLGHACRGLGRRGEAMDYARQALLRSRSIGSRSSEAGSLLLIALLQQDGGQVLEAERNLRRSLSLSESVRESLAGRTDAKLSFLASYLSGYHEHVALLLRLNRHADAFAAVQRTKARAIIDLLHNGRVDLRKHLTDAERERDRLLRRNADDLNARMVAEGVRNQPGSKHRFAALAAELKHVERDLRAFTADLSTRYPQSAQQQAARTISLAEAGRLLPADAILLEYAALKGIGSQPGLDRTVLFAVALDRGRAVVRVHTIPLTRKALAARVNAFRDACANPGKSVQAQARDLYRLLLGPTIRLSTGKRRLIVCPDGPLWGVPFAALQAQDGYLAERFEITYAFSATGAQTALEAAGRRDRPRPGGSALVLANPAFGAGKRFGDLPEVPGQRPIDVPARPIDVPARTLAVQARNAGVLRAGKLVELPGAQREADALKRTFPGAAVYTGQAAQEATAKSEAGRYRYLHFATHGFCNDAAPMLSSIVLADPALAPLHPDTTDRPAGPSPLPNAPMEDGFLTAREIFDLDLRAELVVLSACNTARGSEHPGEGIVGLTWALSAAGAPTQVVSQWSVDDASTATLMLRFYAGLRAGKPKGAALRMASLSLLRDPKYRHPYYWAPFVLMGDWR